MRWGGLQARFVSRLVLDEVTGAGGSLGVSAETVAPATQLRMARQKMDGWMDGKYLLRILAKQI